VIVAGPEQSGTVEQTARAGVAAIAERLGEVLGEPLVGEIRQLSSGASRATYALATASHGELVLQMDRAAKSRSEPLRQAALLKSAAQAGVPVPRVVAEGTDDAALGPNWIVVEAVAGTTDPREILAGADLTGAPALIDSIAAALAAVHRMQVDPGLVPALDNPLAEVRRSYDELGEPHSTFELAFRALGDGPPAERRTFVHGDFRIGNLMVGERGVTAVLDWELAHTGDPVEDLGWLCVPAWRFARPDRPAAGLGTRAELTEAYARHSGLEVDPRALRWWELAGTLRWGVICVMQAFTHLSGQVRSIEHAVIGRRACEVEWDLLELLDPDLAGASGANPDSARTPQQPATDSPRQPATNAPAPPAAGLHDRPSTVELLDAARGALGDDVLPLLDGRAEFQLRVSLRALGIVRRELALAPAHAVVRAAALDELGAADEAALSAAIRRGAFDGQQERLVAALRELVRAKLEAANPRYLEPMGLAPTRERS